MVETSVKQMVENFLKTNPELKLPPVKQIIPVQERIDSILSGIQMGKINVVLKFPENAKNPTVGDNLTKIKSWLGCFNKLKKEGLGREKLVEKLPDFKHPEKIPQKVLELYDKNPVEAGNYAQKYVGYTPFVDYYNLYEREVEEPFEKFPIPQTGDIISFQYDLLSIHALYEFKLTKQKDITKRLREALIQIYIYDFLLRMKNNILHYYPLMIEIYAIDKQKIYQYGGIFSKDFFDVDKDVLKSIFRINNFSKLDLINRIIDEIYDNLEVVFEEDVHNLLRKFKDR